MYSAKSKEEIALEMHLWLRSRLPGEIKKKMPETQVRREILLCLASYVKGKVAAASAGDLIDFTDRVLGVKKVRENQSVNMLDEGETSFLDALGEIS